MSQRDKISYGVSALGRVGFSRDQALGAIGSLMGESGRSMKTTAHNPNDPNGGSIGIGQWHSDRRTALEDFAKTSKYGLYDFRTQMDFVAHELSTTQKNVAAKMKTATSRKQASQIWTQQYERPKKEFEFLGKRAANADYAHSVLGQIKSPQDAADAAHVLDGFGSLTGATDEMSTASAYVDPQVTTADRDAKAAANQNKRSGPFGAVMTAVDDISSQFSGRTAEQAAAARGGVVNHTVDHLGDLGRQIGSDVFGMSFSNPDGTPNEKAGAKADSGFFGETSMGAMMGSVVGGVFGGPMGAIVGGLAGQGISRALDKMSTDKQTVADAEVTQGSAGGVGRAIDGFFGGLGGMFASDEKKAADASARTTAISQAESRAIAEAQSSRGNTSGTAGWATHDSSGNAWSGQAQHAINESKSQGGKQTGLW